MVPTCIILTIWVLLSISLSQNTTLPPTRAPSKPPTVTLTSTHYILVDKCRNWASARTYCEDTYNTTLASIHNEEQMLEAKNLCVQGVISWDWCWIGLNDMDEERYNSTEGWEWADGSVYNYSNWQPGRPDNYQNEDCVHTFSSGLWNDQKCNYCYSSLCMKPITKSPTANPTNLPTTEPTHNPTNNPTTNPISINTATTQSQSASESESGTTSTIVVTVTKNDGYINDTFVGDIVNDTLTDYVPDSDAKLENTALTNKTAEYQLEIPDQRVVLDTDQVSTDIQNQLNETRRINTNNTNNNDGIYMVEVVVVYTYFGDVTPTELWIIIVILVGALCCIIPTFIGLFICYCMYNRRKQRDTQNGTDGSNTMKTVQITTPESINDVGPGLSKQDSLADSYNIKPGEGGKIDLVSRDYGVSQTSRIETVDENVHSFVDNPNVIDTDKGKDVGLPKLPKMCSNDSEALYGGIESRQDMDDDGVYENNRETIDGDTDMGYN